MTNFKVGYLIGSLAKNSINRKLAKALVKLAPEELEMTEIGFADLPLYRPEYDSEYPPVACAFKDAIKAVDALLFVTPEYNRSIPGGLKNAIDFASRPYGQNAFARKPSGVIGASTGKLGTALAQQHLRTLLAYLNSPQLGGIEAYLQYEKGLVDDGFMLEWLSNHSDVVAQPAFDAPHFRGINPYTLGFAIYRDIRRMCEQPTDEDRDVRGINLYVRSDAEQLAKLVALVDSGDLRVDVTRRVPLTELPGIHVQAASGEVRGKVVFLVSGV